MQVKQLEESIGLPLLEQIGKKIYRTEAGEIMPSLVGSEMCIRDSAYSLNAGQPIQIPGVVGS